MGDGNDSNDGWAWYAFASDGFSIGPCATRGECVDAIMKCSKRLDRCPIEIGEWRDPEPLKISMSVIMDVIDDTYDDEDKPDMIELAFRETVDFWQSNFYTRYAEMTFCGAAAKPEFEKEFAAILNDYIEHRSNDDNSATLVSKLRSDLDRWLNRYRADISPPDKLDDCRNVEMVVSVDGQLFGDWMVAVLEMEETWRVAEDVLATTVSGTKKKMFWMIRTQIDRIKNAMKRLEGSRHG